MTMNAGDVTLGAVPASGLTSEQKRVGVAAFIGNAIEQYDFFGYGTGAALVFPAVFYPNMTPVLGSVLAFATLMFGYVFRPLGAVVFSHIGDKVGRKRALIWTLVLMGGSSTLIGLLPGYVTLGVVAPLLLLAMRAIQGFAVGGEGAGAAVLSVEHAPPKLRGLIGAFPQIGVASGLVVANLIFLLMSSTLSHADFILWGWRVPFLLSAVLVAVGIYIRVRIKETPAFEAMQKQNKRARVPLLNLFRKSWRQVLSLILVTMHPNSQGYITIFVLTYGVRELHLTASTMLAFSVAANIIEIPVTFFSGVLSDRVGRRRMVIAGLCCACVIGALFFPIINTAIPALVFLAILVMRLGIALMYGPLYTLYAETFDTNVRYSGIAVSGAISGLIGAQIPIVATYVMTGGGGTLGMSAFLFACSALALTTVLMTQVHGGRDLTLSLHE